LNRWLRLLENRRGLRIFGLLLGLVPLWTGYVLIASEDGPLSPARLVISGLICAALGFAWAELVWHTIVLRFRGDEEEKDRS
jgi:hypothetical protein